MASHNDGCYFNSNADCVTQPGTTRKLDGSGGRLMDRISWRILNGVEYFLVTHTVDVSSSRLGVRWYELQGPSTGALTVRQSGTFSPDAKHRWMGSISHDKKGNIALGFSSSSDTVYPSVYYTGRLANDALNVMQAETVAVSGSGSQTNYGRWGDYASLRVDPVDGCTFFFTTEYLPASGNFNWRTKVVKFSFADCPSTSGGSGGGGGGGGDGGSTTDPASDGGSPTSTVGIAAGVAVGVVVIVVVVAVLIVLNRRKSRSAPVASNAPRSGTELSTRPQHTVYPAAPVTSNPYPAAPYPAANAFAAAYPRQVEGTPSPSSASQWELVWSTEHKAPYYYNTSTAQSSWEVPRELAGRPLEWVKMPPQNGGPQYWWNSKTNQTSWTPPLPVR